MNKVFAAEQLSKTFDPDTSPIHAVKDVSLEICENEIIVLTGRSGSGKSTLLHLLAGLEKKTSGSIFFKENDYDNLKPNELTSLRRAEMGFVYQFHYLLNELSAQENVSLPLKLNNVNQDKANAASIEILDSLGLGHRIDHKPSELSGGEKQRVAIARSLVHSPSLVILDEPTGDLDTQTSLEVINSLKKFVSDKKSSLLIATHDDNFQKIADRKLMMDSGIIE
ncbi:MAG: lipoprotein-releasing system ATP-binding protein LolD [Gammaproteobacteria bacterium]|jgi:lipoprotein-releasing system ATP-binding protein|nr:lipoprotein-releasing system ATP-binding protein LolD [Gammaproteobacteria bacterium]|tara:strand:- start:4432 stop:5103 length:672 start_codon:yes stop_codon:yes gene_type:complete